MKNRLNTKILLVLILLSIIAACSVVTRPNKLLYLNNPQADTHTDKVLQTGKSRTFRAMSLNLAHGRNTSFHQLFVSGKSIKRNLDLVVELIDREKPQFIALQEADGRSFWSGSFNHVEYLLNRSRMRDSIQGYHVRGLGLEYGTALLSSTRLNNYSSHRLEKARLTPPKGFVVSSVEWPGKPGLEFDIVSVHLDFISGRTRTLFRYRTW